jgi:hypothetical protein
MSATRRHKGRPPARKTEIPAEVVTDRAPVEAAHKQRAAPCAIDPVSADPAVVLWDEAACPETIAEGGQPACPVAGDKALH